MVMYVWTIASSTQTKLVSSFASVVAKDFNQVVTLLARHKSRILDYNSIYENEEAIKASVLDRKKCFGISPKQLQIITVKEKVITAHYQKPRVIYAHLHRTSR